MFEKGLLSFKEKLIMIVPIVIVIAILAIFIKQIDKSEYYEDYLIKEEFSGSIIKKFEDYENHGVKKLCLINSKKEVIELYCDDWLELWSNCNLGDSLFKIRGERNLYVYRISKLDTIKLNFNQSRDKGFIKYRYEK